MPRVEVEKDEEVLQDIVDGYDVEGAFGYTANHAPYVNWETHYAGTAPPYKPIREWVHRKWNDLDAGLKRAAMPEETDEDAEEEFSISETDLTTEELKDAVAGLVVGAIAENGTKAVRFMERSIEKVKAEVPALEQQYAGSEDLHAPFKLVRDVLDTAFGISQEIVADEATDTGGLLQSGYVDVEELNTGERHEREGRGG